MTTHFSKSDLALVSLSLHFLLYAASAVLPAHGLFFSPIFFLDQNELRSHQFHKALFH